MKDLALRALDGVARRGVAYADVRAVDSREREISTKNGNAGHVNRIWQASTCQVPAPLSSRFAVLICFW